MGTVVEGSPAVKAGNRRGDTILAAYGQWFDASYSLLDLLKSESVFANGSVVLTVRRENGQVEEVQVLAEADPRTAARYLGVPTLYAKINGVEKSTAAEKADLLAYDLILGIDGKGFDAAHSLSDWLLGKKPGDTVSLLIRRGNEPERVIPAKLGVNRNDKDKAFLGISYQMVK